MKSKEISYRQQRVAKLINAAIVEVLRRGRMLDERLTGCPITITRVEVTADLSIVNCYFLPFNTGLSVQSLAEALDKSKYAIRGFVTSQVKLKYSPEIRFHYDHSFDNSYKVEQLLKRISSSEDSS